jgi:hypothetical protein
MILQSLIERQFKFALKNGAAKLNIEGKPIDAIIIEPPVIEGNQRRGRQKTIKRSIVGVLKSDLPNIPSPGTLAKLDAWTCVVSEEGIEEETFAYRIPLRSP